MTADDAAVVADPITAIPLGGKVDTDDLATPTEDRTAAVHG